MSDTIDPFSIPRPVRTYGRRQKTPEPSEDVDTFYQEAPVVLPGVSPAKGLLNRFETNSSGFLAGLGDIGRSAPASRPDRKKHNVDRVVDSEQAVTTDEVQAMLRKMRQKTTAGSSVQSAAAVGSPAARPIDAAPERETLAVKQILHRSSSLTDAPLSSLHSSPPPAPAPVHTAHSPASSPTAAPARPPVDDMHEETMMIRAPGHKRGKRVSILPVDEDDEDVDEEGGMTTGNGRGSSPTTPTAGPSRLPKTAAARSPSPESPVVASRRPKSQRARRVQSSTPDNSREGASEDAGEADEAAEERASSDGEAESAARAPVATAMKQFFDDLADQSSDGEDAAEVARRLAPKRSESIEDAEEQAGPSRPPKIRVSRDLSRCMTWWRARES